MTVEKAQGAYAALHGIEYGYDLSEELDQALNDVKLALRTFLEMDDLLAELQTAERLITQRNLRFDHFGITVAARPDLLAFFPDKPPLIVDWKVHSFGQHDYRLQLAVYALVLKHSKAHNDFDFPSHLAPYSVTDIRLLEAQLLTQQRREYLLTNDDFGEIESYIGASSSQMLLLVDDDDDNENFPRVIPGFTSRNMRAMQFSEILLGGRSFQTGGQMPGLETNVFPVLNLNNLSSRYCLYKVRGLDRDQDSEDQNQSKYFQNKQALNNKLSYKLKTPVQSGAEA